MKPPRLNTVQKRVKDIAVRFKGCDYFFASWSQINEIADKVHKPLICYILPPSGTLKPRLGATQFTDKPSTLLAFLSRTKLDFNGEKNDEIVESMKRLAKLFLQKMSESDYFESFDDKEIEYAIPYDKLDDCLTGVMLKIDLSITDVINCDNGYDFGYTEKNG